MDPTDENGLDLVGYVLVFAGVVGLILAFNQAGSVDGFVEAVKAFQPIIFLGVASIVGGGAVVTLFKNR